MYSWHFGSVLLIVHNEQLKRVLHLDCLLGQGGNTMIKITPQEIDDMMDWLSSISDKEGKGTTRLLYSDAWSRAQKALETKFRELGMRVEYDEIGNLFGTIEGQEEPDSVIMSGSHVDTVVNGGRLDGQLGIMSAYISIKKLLEAHGQPKKSLRIVSFAEEEGSRFPYAFWGSKNLFGEGKREDVEGTTDIDGVKFEDAMRQAGFDFRSGDLKFNKFDAFLELHIEQGNFLENTHKQVGIVNAIVGQRRFTVTLSGQANHAGTTLMAYRKDAIEGFARIVTAGLQEAKRIGDPLVLTFGRVDVTPNVVNVVPGEVKFSIDCRHTDQTALVEFSKYLEKMMQEVADDMGLTLDVEMWMDEAPVPMNAELVKLLEDVAEENQLNYQTMHSGAGHDSQIVAPHVPTAMIFVPSIDGISHNPEEHTEAVDMVQGIQTLAEALHRLAY